MQFENVFGMHGQFEVFKPVETAQPVILVLMGVDQSKAEIEKSSGNGIEDAQHDTGPDAVNKWIWKYAKILVLSIFGH